MDSFTQIVLGAAVGEVVMGKKIGKRALLWGAIGGTIPDLDVMAMLFMNDLDAIAFHRGIMHSIVFAVFFSFIIAWLVKRLYDEKLYQNRIYKLFVASLNALLAAGIFSGLALISNYNIYFIAIGILVFILFSRWLWRGYYTQPLELVSASYKDWHALFFWSIFTHPLLDCFTSYGTQLFQPFSDYRVAFNTVSVVDPLYTLPFLLCLVAASLLHRTSRARRILNWAGIAWSCVYLAFTVWNKTRVDGVIERSLADQHIDYQRYSSNPSIFNNILWQTVVESDSTYYLGYYSLFDKDKSLSFEQVPKNHELLAPLEGSHEAKILEWFSNDYYNLTAKPNGQLQLNDLRYGSLDMFSGEKDQYVFRFDIRPKPQGGWLVSQVREDRRKAPKSMMQNYWKRILGQKINNNI
jgi:inner membrane protein